MTWFDSARRRLEGSRAPTMREVGILDTPIEKFAFCSDCGATIPQLAEHINNHRAFHNGIISWAEDVAVRLEQCDNRYYQLLTDITKAGHRLEEIALIAQKVREEYPY